MSLPVRSCRSCGAAVLWVTTTAGRLMPVDAEPVEGGNVEVLGNGTAVVHGQPELAPGDRYVAHFVTCPQAETWRVS